MPAIVANAETRTRCPRNPVPSISSEAELDRLTLGVIFLQVGYGSNTQLNSQIVEASASEPCQNGATYVVQGRHSATDLDGFVYQNTSASPPMVVTCQ
jgi:hypothetical protein